MEWLNNLTGGSLPPAVTLVIVTLGIVLVLLLLVWIFRKIAGSNSIKTNRNRRPRLAVTDAAVVDDKRRLVLVRRDNVEHLVMIGGASDVVVETNIVRTQQSPAPSQQQAASAPLAEETKPTTPIAASAAVGAALATGASDAVEVVESGASSTSSASREFAATAASRAESVVEPATQAVSAATTKAAEVADNTTADVKNIITEAIDTAAPAHMPTVETPEPHADIDMSQSLENALVADLQDGVSEPEVKTESVEDEMKRLLSELSAEKA